MRVLSLVWVGTRTTEYAATVAFFKDVLGLGEESSETDFAVLEVPDGATVEVFGPASRVQPSISPTRSPGSWSRTSTRRSRSCEAAGIEIVLPTAGRRHALVGALPRPRRVRLRARRGSILTARRDPKDRMQRRDPAQVLVWRVGADALEERADLPGPLLQVRAQNRRLLIVGNLGGGELLHPAPLSQAALTARPEVAHPLRLAARRHDVALALEPERVHRRAPPLAALAAAHLEDAGAHEAHAEAGQSRDDRVEDVLREPSGRW